MNKILALLFIFIAATQIIFPQESSFYDAPFGGGGGYVGGWIVPNVNGINAQLKNFGVPNLPSSGFYTSGGSGFIYLGVIPNLRIGGIGFSGSHSTSSTTLINISESGGPTPTYVNEMKEAIYSLSGGGLTIEYTLPFIKNFGVSLGATIGRGSLTVQLYKNIGNYDWQYFWQQAENSTSSTFSSSIKNSFWIFNPTLSFDFPAYHLICIHVGTGYQLTFGDSWTYDNDNKLLNVPWGIRGNSFFIQTGIYVGLFSF